MKNAYLSLPFARLYFLLATSANAQQNTPDLIEAISRIERGDFAGAAARLPSQSNDADQLFVRGVALTLSEDFSGAVPALERATQLNPQRAEYNLWLYAAEVMSNTVTDRHAFRIRPAGQPKRLEGTPQPRGQYPAEYGDFIFQKMANGYAATIANGQDIKAPRIRMLLNDAGKRFAEFRWTQPEMAAVNRPRAQRATANGNPGAALFAVLRERDFTNPDWQARLCKAFVFLGRYDSARAACTQALQLNPRAPLVWIYRSYAQAQLGNRTRALSDFAQAERLDPNVARQNRTNLDSLLHPSDTSRQDPAQALAVLERAARSGQPLAELQRLAEEVQFAVNARRLRLDESYVDKLAAFDADPANKVAYARYLLEESNVDDRSENVERVNERVALRRGIDPEAELTKALALADQALRAKPGQAGAMVTRALVLDKLGRSREAEAQIDAVISVAGNDPAALALYSQYQLDKRDRSYLAAASLRTPVELDRSTRTERRSDGEYRVTDRTMRDPSASDYGGANALDRAGDQLSDRAKQAFLQAIRLASNIPDGCILQARYDFHNNRREQALLGAQACAQRFPQSSKAWFALGRLARTTRQYDLEDDARSRGVNLMETTAAPKLRKAWRKILLSDWPAAETALLEAEAVDPGDARIPAYRAIVAQTRQQIPEYTMQLRKALALEEARLSLDESPASAGISRSPSSLALVLRLRTLLAGKATDATAIAIYAGSMVHVNRIDEGDGAFEMWGAMLPDPRSENPQLPGFSREGRVRWPPKAADMVAEIHLNYGRALQANGRAEEGRREIERAGRRAP